MNIKLKVDKRKLTGRKVKRLRAEGIVPANIFGKGIKSQIIQLNHLDMKKAYDEAGETGLIELQVDSDKKGKTDTSVVLISNIQTDPVTDQIIHIDFHEVNLKEKVKAQVPIEFEGESPAVKQGVGTVVTYIDEIEVEALPTDLPENFVVDISVLEKVDDSILIKDLKFDKSKVEIDLDDEEILAKVEELREEEEEPEPVVDPADVPVVGEDEKTESDSEEDSSEKSSDKEEKDE